MDKEFSGQTMNLKIDKKVHLNVLAKSKYQTSQKLVWKIIHDLISVGHIALGLNRDNEPTT